MATTAEIARELRAHGFRTQVRQALGGLMFTAQANRGTWTVSILSVNGATSMAYAHHHSGRGLGQGRMTDDLTEAAAFGLQYAAEVTR